MSGAADAVFSPIDHDPFAHPALTRAISSTEPQREVWLADQLSTAASLAYNESVSLRLRGALDVAALQAATRALVARHDALRASFSSDGQTLYIADAVPPNMNLLALDALPAAERDAEVAKILREEVDRGFDIEQGPLLRARLLRLQAEQHLLVLTAHHIVCDGWSFGVLVHELGQLYAGQLGQAPELPAAVSFTDYALAQAARDSGHEQLADEAYWLSRFADGAPLLDLPTDRPRRAQRSFASQRLDVRLDAALLAQVRKFGSRQGASLFSTLLGTFAATLQRICGGDDFVVGVPAAGQSEAGWEGVVGHCVNLLPLRLRVDAAAPLGTLLASTQATMLDAFEHQHYTFGTLLKKLVLPREPSRLPLVGVMFNLDQALDAAQAGFPGLELGFSGNARTHENFELFVNAVQEGGGLRLECQFNSDLFDSATVQRWMAGFEALLRGACSAPKQALGDLPFVSDTDRALLQHWNATTTPFSRFARVHDLFEAQASRTPDAVALIAGTVTLSYAALEARANQIAHALQARGISPGALIGLHLERSADMLAAQLGVLKAGAAYVPLDPTYPTERVAYMARDSRLALLISDAALAQSLGWSRNLCLLFDADAAQIDQMPRSRLHHADGALHCELPAYVIYTSGSTGKPKGVVVPHRAVVNLLHAMARCPGLTSDDVLLAVTTISFDIAVTELLLPLTVGARIVLANREEAGDAGLLRALIDAHRVNVMQATPATWRLLLAAGWTGSTGFKALCGGEPLDFDLAQQLVERSGSLWNMYGPTETTVWSTCARIERGCQSIDIGRPIANTRIWIVDERSQLCPVGVPGEILIGGEGVTSGYLHRRELTDERFVADPYSNAPGALLYRTGDRGRWRGDGVIEHLGRTDFQVKVRGYRIELGEIEATLLSHESVTQAVVVTQEYGAGDVRLVAYVVPRPGQTSNDAALKAHVKKTLPDYMLPQHMIALAAIPLLPNGKVNRKALPALNLAAATSRDFIAPRNDQERAVAAAMESALSLPGLGVHDNFFALGGHSLLAAQLATAVSQSLGQRVPLRAIFDAPSIAQLAAWIDAQTAGDAAAPMAVESHAEAARAPTSLMQQRLWFLEQLQSGRVTYNTPSAHRLIGVFDLAAFERSFNEMLRRQAVLRTAVIDQDGVPVQHILPSLTVSLQPVEDLSHVEPTQREARLLALMQERVARPIDLRDAPLFRVSLYKLAEQEHVLFFMPHHIIWDGWSFDLLYKEMAALYGAYSQGTEPTLAPLTASYADFAHWQAQWLKGDDLKRQLRHWTERLADLPGPLELPLDRPRPARMSGAGGTRPVAFSQALADEVRHFGQSHDATLYMTLLAVYALLLSRLSGQRELVIGTPVRGRDSAQLENVMGFFVNALPLRLSIEPGQSFVALLAQVRAVVLDAFSAPDVPFEYLVREMNLARDESRSPIYQAFFSFQDARQRTRQWGALRQEQVHVFQPGAAEDLGLWFLEHPQGLAGGLSFNADVFVPATVQRFVERYQQLLTSALAEPQRAVGELAYATAHERVLLEGWNGTAAEPVTALSVAALLQAQAIESGTRVALRCGDTTLTYADLDAQANRLAHALRARGIARGALVGLCLERSPDMLVAQLAILKSGAAYVPLDPAYPAERLIYMAGDARLALLVTHSSLMHVLPWPRSTSLLVDLDAAAWTDLPATALPREGQLDAATADPAYVIYTSGSTGKPKGVVVPHGAVLNFLASMAREPGLAANDRLLAVTTLSFDIAVLELLLPLAVGAQVVLASTEVTQSGPALRALLETSGANVMQATPSTWRMLLEAGWAGAKNFKALIGGESLPIDLAQTLRERCGSLWNLYGPTETTVWSTCWKVELPLERISIGRPIANTSVHVRDEQGQPCAIGVSGEICIGGGGVATGYLRRPELTAERFVTELGAPGARLYRTGDLGRWCSDGLLEHLGRIDSQVKVRGHRIELGEIETCLASHPQVAQALIVVREDTPGDVRLVAYVIGRADQPSASALRAHLRLSLPEYMLPQHLVPIERMPLLPNGKIDRRALPAPSENTQPTTALQPLALSETEQNVARVWQDILGISDISAADNFFDLGGHSLIAMRAVMEMEKRLSIRIAVRRLVFESLAQIAATPVELIDAALDVEPARPGLLSRVFGRLGRRS